MTNSTLFDCLRILTLSPLHFGHPCPDKWSLGLCSKTPWVGQTILTLVWECLYSTKEYAEKAKSRGIRGRKVKVGVDQIINENV